MLVVLLGNQLVKTALRVLGKANGVGWLVERKAGWREGVRRCCEVGLWGGAKTFPKELAGFRPPSEIPPQLLY